MQTEPYIIHIIHAGIAIQAAQLLKERLQGKLTVSPQALFQFTASFLFFQIIAIRSAHSQSNAAATLRLVIFPS